MSHEALEKFVRIASRNLILKKAAALPLLSSKSSSISSSSFLPSSSLASPSSSLSSSSILEVNLASATKPNYMSNYPCWRCGQLGHQQWRCANASQWPHWIPPVYDEHGNLQSGGTGGAMPTRRHIKNVGDVTSWRSDLRSQAAAVPSGATASYSPAHPPPPQAGQPASVRNLRMN